MDRIERLLLKIPWLGRAYARRAATIKRTTCLVLARFGLLKPVTFVQWLVTAGCNFTCEFCEASAGPPGPDELSTAEATAMIDDLAQMGVRRLVFSGGEPLIRKDLLDLAEHAGSKGLKLGLVTNGFLVPALWHRIEPLPLYLYFTSLDGPREYHDAVRGTGSFERVLEGLDLAASKGVPARMINTVVRADNLSMLAEMREIVRASGANSWRLTPVANVGRAYGDTSNALDGEGLREVVSFLREMPASLNADLGESHTYVGQLDGGMPVGKPFFCGAGLTRASIMEDGSVLGCHQVYDTRFAEGNVKDRPFSEIWRTEFGRFRAPVEHQSCTGCEHQAACRSGCWAEMAIDEQCAKPVWNDQGTRLPVISVGPESSS